MSYDRGRVSRHGHDVDTPSCHAKRFATHLLVKLANVVVGLILSLLESRVLLNFLGGGHLEKVELFVNVNVRGDTVPREDNGFFAMLQATYLAIE